MATFKNMTGKTKIPDGWRLVRLGKVADINRCAWKPTDDSRILYLDLTSVLAPGRLAPPKEILTEEAPTRARRKVCSGDILISTVRPYLQGFARVRKAQSNLVCSTGFAVLTPLTGVNESFLYHEVMTPWFLLYLQGAMTGQAYPAVRPDDVAGYGMPLPPLPEQRAIAAVLDSIDEAIEDTGAVIAATERLRDALLHRLLTRGVPGWHSEWKDVRGLGTIPASWNVVRLGEVAESITSGSRGWSRYFRSSGAFFVRSQNITASGIDHADAIFVDPPSDGETKRTRISRGDILISITGEPGKTTIASEDIGQAFVSQHVALVRLRDRRLSCFASRFLQGQKGQDQFRQMAYGQTRPGLSLLNIGEAKIALPQLSEQRVMVLMMDSVDEAIERGRTETEMLQSLKASAADALLTGRVRVRQTR